MGKRAKNMIFGYPLVWCLRIYTDSCPWSSIYIFLFIHAILPNHEKKSVGLSTAMLVAPRGVKNLSSYKTSFKTVCLYGLWTRYNGHTLGPTSQWVSRSYRQFQGHQRENKKNAIWISLVVLETNI